MTKKIKYPPLLLSYLILLGEEIETRGGLYKIQTRYRFGFMFDEPYLVHIVPIEGTELMFTPFNREGDVIRNFTEFKDLKAWILEQDKKRLANN